jgi:DNA-binding NarL/FixJ family response regulator
MDALHVTEPSLGKPLSSSVENAPALGVRLTVSSDPVAGRAASRLRSGSYIRVLVAGGQALMRASLSAVLGSGPRIVVVGEAATDDEAIALARRATPDVILIDGSNGLHVLGTARRMLADPELAGTRVVMLGRIEREEDVLAALRIGIGGLVDRDAAPYELVQAVRMAAGGAAFVVSSTTRRLVTAARETLIDPEEE